MDGKHEKHFFFHANNIISTDTDMKIIYILQTIP